MLLFEQDADFRKLLYEVSTTSDWRVSATGQIDEFMRRYDSAKPSIIVLNASMPEIEGKHVIQWLADRQCAATIVISYSSFSPVLSLAQRLADDGRLAKLHMLQKPFSVAELRNLLK